MHTWRKDVQFCMHQDKTPLATSSSRSTSFSTSATVPSAFGIVLAGILQGISPVSVCICSVVSNTPERSESCLIAGQTRLNVSGPRSKFTSAAVKVFRNMQQHTLPQVHKLQTDTTNHSPFLRPQHSSIAKSRCLSHQSCLVNTADLVGNPMPSKHEG